jgi:NitT/TauT family transport system substrate-binding protein
MGHPSLLSVFQAYQKGVHFVIVAPSGLYLSDDPQAILIVKKDSAVKTGRDLNNTVIGVSSLQDLNAAATMGWIDQHGGDSKTVKVVELTNSAIVPAIDQGRISAATVTAPYKDIAIQSGVARMLGKSFDAVAKTFMVSGYVTTADAVVKKRDAMRRFALAMHESAVYCNTHPAEMIDVIASYTQISPDVLTKSPRTIDPEYTDPKLIQPFIDFAAKYGLLDHPFEAKDVIADVADLPPH